MLLVSPFKSRDRMIKGTGHDYGTIVQQEEINRLSNEE